MFNENTNYINKIKNIFINNGYNRDKLIEFLIYKLIIINNKNSINNFYNKILEIKYLSDKMKYDNKIETLKNIEYKIKEKTEKLAILELEIKNIDLPCKQKCSICLDEIKTHIIVPCGHKCLCDGCAKQVIDMNSCPICRTPIKSVIKVFE